MPFPERERADRYLHAQCAVSRLLADSSTIREVTSNVLRVIGETTGWDVGVMWGIDSARNELRCLEFWHSPTAPVSEFEVASRQSSFPPGQGLPGRVWEQGKPCWIADVTQDANFPRVSTALREGLRGAFAFPIRLENKPLGVIEFFSRESREPDEAWLRTTETIGYQIGQFLQRRRAESELRTSAERYRLILENALEYAIFTTDREGLVATWNAGAQRILGHEEQEITGRSLDLIFTPEDRQTGRLQLEMRQATEEGRAKDERWHLRKDGSRFWASGLMMPLNDEDGHLLGFLKILRDRTSKKRSEEALRASEARFRQLADAMPQIVWTALPDGSIDYYNKRWFELTGFPAGQPMAENWKSILHADDVARWNERWSAAITSGEPFQMECRFRNHKAVSYRWFLARALPVRDDFGEIFRWYGTFTDIDAQKRAEDQFVRLNQTLLSVLEAFPDIVFVLGIDGSIRFKNPAAGRFARAVGMEGHLPAPLQSEWEHVLQTGEDHLPTDFKTVHRFEINQEERYFLSRIVAMRTPDDTLFGATVVLQDVTDLRLLDEIKTNLISTVSHELKTPITSVRTVLLMLREGAGQLSPKQGELVGIACAESERLLRTLDTLLDLTRFEESSVGIRLETVTPAQIIQAAVEEANVTAVNAGIRLQVQIETNLPLLAVDREQILHVLSNFITNAIKYSPPESEVLICARRHGSNAVYFSVADRGPGVPQQYQSRIFERFFRVPGNPKKGAGLGLSIARGFVRAHRGRIGVRSEAGKGSEFYFILPSLAE